MEKICEQCQKMFSISRDEISMNEKVGIELPSQCFYCRARQLFSFWLFGKFRKGVSDLSGDSLITILPNNPRYPIYTLKEWHSDKWDAMNYDQNYDPDRSFFDQLKELQEKIPRPHQTGINNTGCDWCDDTWECKNSYLSRSMVNCEDLYYSYRNIKVKNSIDMVVCFDSENCFDCINCYNSYKIFYSRNSKDCIDSYFLQDCRNCQSCFMCWNLRGKSYCISNKQYTKEEYTIKIKSFNLDSYKNICEYKKQMEELAREKVIHRENFNLKIYNSKGNFLLNDKDCHNCNTISDSEDCYNCIRNGWLVSDIDVYGSMHLELSGLCCLCQPSGYALKYSSWSSARYSEYLDMCIDCEYCFGCVGLKKKKYCILNKQYEKKEYEILKNEIIKKMKINEEYGKFLPYSMAPGPFNFSNAIIYFPNTEKEDILKSGGYWEDINENHIEGIKTDELPDSINDVDESICSKPLICPKTGWRFNIAQNELVFYKQNNIPLPRYHFDVRIINNMKYATVINSYKNNCHYCKKEINAYYPPEWGYQNIACEDCYKQNIN